VSPSETGIRRALGAVALAGLGVAAYLTAERAAGRAPACPIGGGCETVQASRYAEVAGIPVAWLGLVGYGLLLVAALWPGKPGRGLGLFAATVGIGFTAWLTYAEVALIGAICAWCVASAALMSLAFLLAVLRVATQEAPPARRADGDPPRAGGHGEGRRGRAHARG
jgi:uncharacterized membrane protein